MQDKSMINNDTKSEKMKGGEKMSKTDLSGWLFWVIIFLIVAIAAGLFGFGLISGASYTIAKWLAIIFVVLFIISIIAHVVKKA